MEEQQYVRCDSSWSDESLSTVTVQHRIAAEQHMREEELEGKIAQLEAKIAGGSDDAERTSHLKMSKGRESPEETGQFLC